MKKPNTATVTEKIKQITSKAAPSMVPAPAVKPELPPPPPKEEEVVPDIATVIQDRRERLKLARLVEEYGELGVQKSAINKAQKPLNAEIKKLVGIHQIGKALCGEWRINYYSTPRATLKPELLRHFLKTMCGLSDAAVTNALEYATELKSTYNLKISREGVEEEGEE